MQPHLLYVEDDESLSFVTRDNLELQGYRITYCADGASAMQKIKEDQFDLCILDVMLPDVDGFMIAQEIRKTNVEVPIIFLTARSLKEDKIHGLKLGADDYMTKPFSIEELLLKIQVFLKRSKVFHVEGADNQLGDYLFDYKNLSLRNGTYNKVLTQKEADLLNLFFLNQNLLMIRC